MAEKKTRLDVAVFERGLTDSRAKAGALIMAGQVFVNGKKPYRSKNDKRKRKDVSDNGTDNYQHDPGGSPVCVQPEQPA